MFKTFVTLLAISVCTVSCNTEDNDHVNLGNEADHSNANHRDTTSGFKGKLGGLSSEKSAWWWTMKSLLKKLHGDIEVMAKQEFQSITPISYRTQVVNGKNFYIKAKATYYNGAKCFMHIKIHKPLKGDAQLLGVRKNVKETDALQYFR